MTPSERTQILQLVSQILIDNNGNRITRALCVGICAEIDNNVPPATEPVPAPENEHG